MRKVLIIGKIPPPIGGVTVHVKRLLDGLRENEFRQFSFCDLQNDWLLNIVIKIFRHKVIHLHVSDPFVQLSVALLFRICFKKLILTYHGNWGRYGLLGNWAVNLSAWMAFIPIVQNEESFTRAKFWNKKSSLISTFIPSKHIEALNAGHALELANFRQRFKVVFCTNAWNVTFDKAGDETYGISQIILNLLYVNKAGLIVSDPSGNYKPFIEKIVGSIPAHILFIQGVHDFRNVLQVSEAFIRNTTTDGVSLSIFEAYEQQVVVLASDRVSRPGFCYVYHDIAKVNLFEALDEGRKRLGSDSNASGSDAVEQLIKLYKQCL